MRIGKGNICQLVGLIRTDQATGNREIIMKSGGQQSLFSKIGLCCRATEAVNLVGGAHLDFTRPPLCPVPNGLNRIRGNVLMTEEILCAKISIAVGTEQAKYITDSIPHNWIFHLPFSYGMYMIGKTNDCVSARTLPNFLQHHVDGRWTILRAIRRYDLFPSAGQHGLGKKRFLIIIS